ncbi:MAG: alpha/beta hydrolase [Myxococcales bacterium]|nr:MAG: alpha/beta hydrolase [Myxococcales bacterium]
MLAHSVIAPKSAAPGRYMLFLHGILGTRANWRGIARRFVGVRPGWGAILVDLREHGDSLGIGGPHTLSAAAADVTLLEESLDLPIGGALGHSFGGKVVLQWLRGRDGQPTEAWIVDASPSVSSAKQDASATAEVLRVLAAMPRTWASREAFVAAVAEAGQPEPIAHWLAKNLRRTDDGHREFGPDLGVIHDLIQDYARTDLWDVVEAPPGGCTLDFVIGGRSAAFSELDRERIAAVAERDSRVRVYLVEEAGHWVHIDSPDRLIALLTSRPSETP